MVASPQWTRLGIAAGVTLGVVALATHGLALAGLGGAHAAAAVGSTLAALVAFVGAFCAARNMRTGRIARAWRLWAAATGSWLLAALARDADLLGAPHAIELASTAFAVLFVLFGIAGLAYRAPNGSFSFHLFLLDALPVVLLVSMLVRLGSGTDLDSGSSGGLFQAALAALYALLAVLALQVFLLGGFRQRSAFWLVASGFTLAGLAGLYEAGVDLGHHTFHASSTEAIWSLAILLIGAAGWRRAVAPEVYPRVPPLDRERGVRSLPPAAATVGMLLIDAFGPAGAAPPFLPIIAVTFLATRFFLVRRASGRLLDAFEASETRFQSVFESAGTGMALVGVDGRIVARNRALAEMLGTTPDALEDVESFSFTHSEDAAVERPLFAELIAGERDSYTLEKRYVRADGSILWVDLNTTLIRDRAGDPQFAIGLMQDITARRDAEDEVREAERRYRTLVEELPLVTYVEGVSEQPGSQLYVSPQIGPLLGYEPQEWTASAGFFAERLHPDDRERVLAERSGGGRFRSEYRLLARDGEVVWVRDEGSLVDDGSGGPLYIQGYRLDITDRKRTEAEREALLDGERTARAEAEEARQALAGQNERLRELDRLKDEFVALVSHELRTPLTSIKGYIELLVEDDEEPLSEEQRRFLAVVQRNAERLERLVGDLLFVAQVEANRLTLQLAQVDVVDVAAECVEAAGPHAAQKEIEVVLDAEPVQLLDGDRARLAQLLDNLVSNAIKFTPAGGRVTVRVRERDDAAVLEVCDTGMGVPADELPRLFERFFRTSNANEQAITGTGLGLAITKAIVGAHRGRISVESEEGVGTTFRAELPLLARLSDRDLEASAAA